MDATALVRRRRNPDLHPWIGIPSRESVCRIFHCECRISTAMVIPESFELQATSDVQIFREPPSRLRVPYQSDRGRSPSASCLRHDRPFHGAPQPSDEPWRRFRDAQLPCYARLVPCRCSFGIDISTLLNPLQVMNHASSHPAQAGGRLLQRFPPTSPRTRDHIWSCGLRYGRGSLPEECSLPHHGIQARGGTRLT